METSEIFDSGFVKEFILNYYEDKFHSYYPDKDRLLYVMCNTEAEKLEVTNQQLEIIKSKIKKLGWEDLSFAYLLSSKDEKGVNYIMPEKRFDFWLNRFAEEFQNDNDTFFPIFDAFLKLPDDFDSDESTSDNQLNENSTKEDIDIGQILPKNLVPKKKGLSVRDLMQFELDIENLIKNDIEQYTENGYWEFDFEEYEEFIESNRVIQDLFEISELFVELNRFDMFNSFLTIDSEDEMKTHTLKEKTSNKHRNENLNLTDLTDSINNAFFKLECFMNGKIDEYKHFEFDKMFSQLFIETKKNENYTFENCNLVSQYWTLCYQIARNFDGEDFENDAAYENDDFCNDCNEIEKLYWNRMEEFECFFPQSVLNESESRFSITDILQNREISHKQPERKSTKSNQPILSDFLNNSSDLSLLVDIQKEFKNYNGKRLAILIYLLQTERKILNIIPKSRTHSRKHFVCLFKEDNHFNKMFAVDKYIDSYSNNLNLPTINENDADYIDVKEKLNKIIENLVV